MPKKLDEYLKANYSYYSSGRPYEQVFVDIPEKEILINGLREPSRFLITGPPGTGKTSLLDAVSLAFSEDSSGVPVFISLRSFSSSVKDLVQFAIGRFDEELSLDELRLVSASEGKRIIFLFDGLDEVPPGIRAIVENEIQNFSDEHLGDSFAVTSRYRPEILQAPTWKHLQIEPLTEQQVRDSLLRIHNGGELLDSILQQPHLDEMVRRPLFLQTLIRVWEQNGEIDEYFIDQIALYSSWRGHSKSTLDYLISADVIEKSLAQVALETVISGEVWFSKNRLRTLLEISGTRPQEINALETVFLNADPIQVDGERVRYRHKSYLTSFAAQGLRNLLEDTEALRIAVLGVLGGDFQVEVIEDLVNSLSDERFRSLSTSLPQNLLRELMSISGESFANRFLAIFQPTGTANALTQALTRVENYLAVKEGRRKDVVVITVHGFNTRGEWQGDLGFVLGRETDGERFIHRPTDYGNFRFRILNPFARHEELKRFHRFYNNLKGMFDDRTEFCVVAHSFGSYIIGNALKRYPEIIFDRILLLGSVLPTEFEWDELSGRGGSVLNFIGGEDGALFLARFVPGLGMSGRNGFTSNNKNIYEIVENNSGHGDLFGELYMKQYWVPFLRDGSVPNRV